MRAIRPASSLALVLSLALAATAAAANPCSLAPALPTGVDETFSPPAADESDGVRQRSVVRGARLAMRSDSSGGLAIVDHRGLIEAAFRRFDPRYLENRALRMTQLAPLKAELLRAQQRGESRLCSAQRLAEAEWLVSYTALWTRADAAIDALETSLAVIDQSFAARQDSDGDFGGCRSEWLFQLDATINALNTLYGEASPSLETLRPFVFLDRIEQPYMLTGLMTSKLVSVIDASGVYGREEVASLFESTAQLVFKPYLRDLVRRNGAPFLDNAYQRSLARYLDAVQDPVTGFWGPVVSDGSNLLRFVDLSMTYHIIAYRGGCVEGWPKIARTLFAIRDLDYPFGWRFDGRPNAHNNYDVVRILKYAWPRLDAGQQARARSEIAAMIDWTLREAIRPDGMIVNDPDFYVSAAAADYFTVSFLDAAGYFSDSAPFWADRPVAAEQGAALCRLLRIRLGRSTGRFEMTAAALARLNAACP